MLAPMRVLRLAKSIQSINQSNYMMVDTLFRPQGLFSKHMAGGGGALGEILSGVSRAEYFALSLCECKCVKYHTL